MNEFERLTKSPEVLGGFLRSLPCLDGPWDAEFHKRFCAGCAAENCDTCPNEQYRNNPVWWLNLETEDGDCVDKYAVIVTFNGGATTGAVVEAESPGDTWKKVFAMFKPETIASVAVSMILTPERGG